MGELDPKIKPTMIAAGLERMRELASEEDRAYVVEAIYLAMEYQRLDELGKLTRLHGHSS